MPRTSRDNESKRYLRPDVRARMAGDPDYASLVRRRLVSGADTYLKHRILYRGAQLLSFTAFIGYPIVLGFTDHLIPSGNLPLDIGKYGLELVLGSIVTGSTVAVRRQKGKRDNASGNLQAFLNHITTDRPN